MVTIKDTIVVERPVEAVWRFVSDPNYTPRWFEGACVIRRAPEGSLAIGATFEVAVQAGGVSQVIGARCTVLDQNRTVAWQFTSGPTEHSTDTWCTEAVGESLTRLTRAFDLRVSGVWTLLQPIIVQGTRKAHAAEIKNVKRILESRESPST